MAKKNAALENVAIDKMELFINRNFKKIIGILILIIVTGLAGYGLKQYLGSKSMSEANRLGDFEVTLNSGDVSQDLLNKYIKTCETIPDMKDYCYYRAGVILVGLGDPRAKEYLKKVSGEYREFADSILYDLGEKVDINQYKENGKLNLIWKYRLAVKDKKQLASFDNETLNTRLISSIKNWE